MTMNAIIKSALSEIDELARTERYDEALRRVQQLTAEHPSEPWIWRTRGYVNSRQGNTQAAIADLSRAIAMQGIEPDFYYTRGILFFQERSFKKAVMDFTKVIELCDHHRSDYYREGAYFFRADAFVRLREFEKAKSDCRHVKDGMRTWTDQLRTKEGILKECGG